jgi:isocitrate dehydrogenase
MARITLEKVCIDTVESGLMTRDSPRWSAPTRNGCRRPGFLDRIDENLKKAMV